MAPELVERRGHASLDLRSREKKAEKIRAILEAERELGGCDLLEVGVGSGAIAAGLADAVKPSGGVWGVDVRDSRVVTEGFRFVLVQDTSLPFADRFFDVVVSNHVLEHVGPRPEQLAHFREIARVLKDDGVAYLATPNRWALLEPHFHLPLLSCCRCERDRPMCVSPAGDGTTTATLGAEPSFSSSVPPRASTSPTARLTPSA